MLFLCYHNAGPSILAESILRHEARARFRAFSAGREPMEINPLAMDFLRSATLPVDGLRSKGWEEFTQADSPKMHFVITVCDRMPEIYLPSWPGNPVQAHWSVAEKLESTRSSDDIRDAFWILMRRIKIFTHLPLGKTKREAIAERLNEIGVWG